MIKEKKIIDKYLARYADNKLLHCDEIPFKEYQNVLVIPAYQEGMPFVENLQCLAKTGQVALVIIVINHPHDPQVSHATDGARASHVLFALLKNLGQIRWWKFDLCLIELGCLDLLIMGPFAMEKRFGVGLARKFGVDAALHLQKKNIVAGNFIHCTDADAVLPSDYFERARSYGDAAAVIYPFFHQSVFEPRHQRAISLYELRLNQYVVGLTDAGSPYGFHTIGSTIAVNGWSYAAVRGFPKLSAGEDFYLLNKLKKVGEIKTLGGSPIKLAGRVSTRVPFGTGPALAHILRHENPNDAPIFYHPQVFAHLHKLFVHQRSEFARGNWLIGKNIQASDHVDHLLIEEAMAVLKGTSQMEKNLKERKQCDRERAFNSWFDGFLTLKFIHYLRDRRFPMKTFNEIANEPKQRQTATQAEGLPL